MTLQTGKIYKVKEGHEGKCQSYKNIEGDHIGVFGISTTGFIYYDIFNELNKFLCICSCFTEDDLELEEEVKTSLDIQREKEQQFAKDWGVNKAKSLEDLEVGDEVIDEFGYIYQIKERGFRLESITNHAVDSWRNLESIKEDFKLVKSLSPSEAETLLEEKLGIKVKIKN